MLAWKVLRLELQFVILLNAWKDLRNPSLYLMLDNLSLFGPPVVEGRFTARNKRRIYLEGLEVHAFCIFYPLCRACVVS